MSDFTPAQRIKRAFEETGMSYAEFEKATGISKSALQRYASGVTKKIPVDVMEKIAPVLGVSISYLMGWDENAPPRSEGHTPKRPVSDEEIKFALFGDTAVDDQDLADVKRFAAFIAQKKKETG